MRQPNDGPLQWHARIDKQGRPAGTGFLIDDQHLLTCAHVAGDGTGLEVVFTGMQAMPATCRRTGGWDGSKVGVGDVAVLELSQPVRLRPAPFATLNTLQMHADEVYQAFGYPLFGFAQGVGISVTVRPLPLMHGASCQIDGDTIGVELAPGFSGSAVYRKGTYEVVGMITSAAWGSETDIGAMLPIGTLTRYLPELLDLIPVGPFAAPAYQDLNRLLGGLRLHNPGRFYSQALGPDLTTSPSEGEFAFVDAMSILEAICEIDREPEIIKRYASRLLVEIAHDQKSPELKSNLVHWMQRHALFDDIQVSELPPAHIVIKIASSARAKNLRHVTIWTVQNDEFEENVFDGDVREGHLQTSVEQQLCVAIGRIPLRVSTIVLEFVLPRAWLSLPVDEWTDLDDDGSRLGWSRPVVVRDLESFERGASRELKHRSERANESTEDMATMLRRRDCEHDQAGLDHFKAWLRGPERPLAVAMAGRWAGEEWISAVIAGGVPVIMWPRRTCQPHLPLQALDCRGMRFTDALIKRFASIRLHDLAGVVKELRAEAASGGDFHCGDGISLFLDKSDRRPPKALLGYA